ncbi:hypothetical protein HK405_002631 [Cladochytrium tenue]|nr:hypothetical protein HK405_002631 [Cladochytrium tenue]
MTRAKVSGYRRCATAFNSAYRSGLDLMPQHIYLSLYVGFGHNSPKPDVESLEYVRGRQLEQLRRNLPEVFAKYAIPEATLKDPTAYRELRNQALENIAKLNNKTTKSSVLEKIRLFRQVSGSILGLEEDVYECTAEREYEEVSLEDVLSEPDEADTVVDEPPFDDERMDTDLEFADTAGLAPAGYTIDLQPEDSASLIDYLRLILRAPQTPLDMAKDADEYRLLQRMALPFDLDKLSKVLEEQIKGSDTSINK